MSELREAARALDPDRVIAALAAAFESWRAPGSSWRERLALALPIYSRAVLDAGICRGLETWNASALRALHDREKPSAPGLAAVWLADTPPTGTFAALALPLLAGCAVHAKPASSDTVTPALFAESIRLADAGVAAALAVDADDRVLDEADALVVYGGDQTVAKLRERAGGRLFIGYGHKLSVAAVGPAVDLDAAAASLAVDVCLWDGRGCLSPAFVFADGVERAERLTEKLSRKLEATQTTLPRGELSSGEEIALRERRGREALLGRVCRMSKDTTDWGVFLGGDPAPGTLRNVPVVAVDGVRDLGERCAALAPHLSSLGEAGWAGVDLAPIAEAGGGSRVCPLGRMQLPPIDWPHDGMGALQPMDEREA